MKFWKIEIKILIGRVSIIRWGRNKIMKVYSILNERACLKPATYVFLDVVVLEE